MLCRHFNLVSGWRVLGAQWLWLIAPSPALDLSTTGSVFPRLPICFWPVHDFLGFYFNFFKMRLAPGILSVILCMFLCQAHHSKANPWGSLESPKLPVHLWPWISWQQRSHSPGTSAHQASPAPQKTLFHGIMHGAMCSPSPEQVPFASPVGMRRRQSFSPRLLVPSAPQGSRWNCA